MMSEEQKRANNKASHKKYNHSDKRKIVSKRYRQSEKGKATSKKYNQSKKGKVTRNKAYKKYQQSEKSKAVSNKYRKSVEGKATKEKYQQSQKGKTVHNKANKKYDQSEKGKINNSKKYARRKRNLGFIPLMGNPFPEEILIDYHHINNIFVILVPRQTHRSMLGKNHRIKVNDWIEEHIGLVGI